MTMVEAVIRKERLEPIVTELAAIGHVGITVRDVMGHGKQQGIKQEWRGRHYVSLFVPKVQISLLVKDDMVDAVIQKIQETATTGYIGDGIIWTMPVGKTLRIRANEPMEP